MALQANLWAGYDMGHNRLMVPEIVNWDRADGPGRAAYNSERDLSRLERILLTIRRGWAGNGVEPVSILQQR